MTLSAFFEQHPKVALAFSGGTDSAFLLHVARKLGVDVKPYFIQTPFQPQFELEDARKLAPDVTIVPLDILENENVASNPENRCYHCKLEMLLQLKEQAKADGYEVLLDGTNASDQWEDRPGMKALEEVGVLSPLRICGLKKEEIRQLSREAGLFTWDKPAYACLATRIPTNTPIDRDTLRRVEEAETALFRLGYRDFRVRVFHQGARVQLPQDQFPMTKEAYIRIREAVAPFFATVLLDLGGR